MIDPRRGYAPYRPTLTGRSRDPALIRDERLSVVDDIDVPAIGTTKDYLAITHGEDDGLLVQLTEAAQSYYERVTGHYLARQQRRAAFDLLHHYYRIPAVPFVSLDAAEIVHDGTTQALPLDDWFARDAYPPEVLAKDGISVTHDHESVRFTYTVGYDDPADVPADTLMVLHKMISDLYEDRTTLAYTNGVPRELALTWSEMLVAHKLPYML